MHVSSDDTKIYSFKPSGIQTYDIFNLLGNPNDADRIRICWMIADS